MAVQPIDLYYWPTPNGIKAAIMFEETGLPYEVHPINIARGDQFEPEFLKISPNNKIPAIVDPDGPEGRPFSLFESGAILLYLAEKTDSLQPRTPEARWTAMQWLMFQMGGIGPMLGQAHHFRKYAPEKIPYAIERYTNEAARLYGVLDERLGEAQWLAGDEYSIADIATWPWIRSHKNQGQDLDDFPSVRRWFDEIAARPAVQRGIAVLAEERERGRRDGSFDDKAREILFGNRQYRRG